MATLKKLLEAARLIERTEAPASASTEDSELDAIIRRAAQADAGVPPRTAAEAPAERVAEAADSIGVEEGLTFTDIYARQSVAEAQFPVERLLKLVEGLRALDPTTRRAAIMAMDVADETWSMDQVLADADAKVAALRGHQRQMQGAAEGVVQTNRERVSALESSRDGRLADLRQQISALEAQIQDVVGTTAADVAKLQSESESNKAALLRETQRIDAHILNLEELVAQFRAPVK
jgi:hypothetical protein